MTRHATCKTNAGIAASAIPPDDPRRGAALIMVTVVIVALLAFAVVAIDGAVIMTAKGQLQNAADAAALAGASGLLEGGEALARARAIEFASCNHAVQDQMRPVTITAEDISFPDAYTIRVQTHRTVATGDALRTYFRRVANPLRSNQADVTAVAVAMAADLCGSKCLRPWAIPDQWNDADGDGEYDEGEYYEPEVTSYCNPADLGRTITLKVGSAQQAIASGIFFAVNYPPLDYPGESPLTGASWYRTWIEECNPYTVAPGDRLQMEPGNMVGPTFQGMEGLIAKDPGAYWDASTQTIRGSNFGTSPRMVPVPFFDPTLPPTSGRNWVTVTKIGVFFIEEINGNEVVGRFVQMMLEGIPCDPGAPGNGQAFIQGISLIQ